MARTIGKRWPSTAPRKDYPAYCAFCGVKWRRSELRRDTAGRLVCPDEGDGLDEVILTQMNADGARKSRRSASQLKDGITHSQYEPVASDGTPYMPANVPTMGKP